MLRTAESVVEVGLLVAAVCDWRESVVREVANVSLLETAK